MNLGLISNWNGKVSKTDTVYVLGDFIMCGNNKERVMDIINTLNGKIYLILGDHDRSSQGARHRRLKIVDRIFDIKPKDCPPIILSHYPIHRWAKSHYNSWHLYGHCHGRLDLHGKTHDVGVDINRYSPISLDKIIEIMRSKPDNPNLIKKREKDVKSIELKQLELPFYQK